MTVQHHSSSSSSSSSPSKFEYFEKKKYMTEDIHNMLEICITQIPSTNSDKYISNKINALRWGVIKFINILENKESQTKRAIVKFHKWFLKKEDIIKIYNKMKEENESVFLVDKDTYFWRCSKYKKVNKRRK